jgi:hypothetical protein
MSLNMNKKLCAIIIIVFLCLAGLVITLSQLRHQQADNSHAQEAATPSLKLTPNPALLDSSGTITVAVGLDTGQQSATGISFQLQYSPQDLTLEEIEPDDAFFHAEEAVKNVDTTTGAITYKLVLHTDANNPPIVGNDHIAELKFTKKTDKDSTIQILPGSIMQTPSGDVPMQSTSGTTVSPHF